ncbi:MULTISPECIES: IS630 family transposase [Mycobacterium]|uniref:IS630 family transposase n=2 Tax=Mycobacterium TaxID=1763 RepID=A0ABY3UW55_MYCLN|nr:MULTISPECIES: IS630 family transposase [Mycobacterium]ULP43805.1 IS630 family transposase [Mycobacterium lentiflavum]
MSPTSTDRITLTGSQRRELNRMTRAGRTEQRLVTRAKIVLAAAAGESNAQIARRLQICEDTVRKWRCRWCAAPGAASLADAKRSGRRPKFTAVQVARVKAMACTPLRDKGIPLSRWSCPELAQQAITDGICGSISPATIRRWLSEDALKPWQYRSWIFITDPGFATKAQRVLDLYNRTWDGKPLGDNDYVISADEKTSIQARCRCHPTLAPGVSRAMRVNHDYDRGGALAYLAAYDVHHAQVFGRCEDTTGIEPFARLVTQVMTQQPYASADRVFWIVDNGSSHRGQAAMDRLAAQFPNAIMVHTPVHASWLNQIEIYFSIVQRKALSPNDFTDIEAVSDRLSAFEDRYNATARPFKWKFTTSDLANLLDRLDQHQPMHAGNPAQPCAA